MHRVLHTFYDAQRYGREIGDEQLLENFRADLATAGIRRPLSIRVVSPPGQGTARAISWVGAAGRRPKFYKRSEISICPLPERS